MPDFPNQFIKIFNHEKKRDYDNRAILGGLVKIVPFWTLEASKNHLPVQLQEQITSLLTEYESSTLDKRKRNITIILGLLESSSVRNERTNADSKKDDRIINAIGTGGNQSGLNAPVTVIHRIGSQTARLLAKLGIHTIKDLLHYYPRRYRDLSMLKPINRLNLGEDVSLIASIYSINLRKSANRNIKIIEGVVEDGTGRLHVTWFNQPWLLKGLPKGKQVILSGRVDRFMGRLTMNNPEMENLDQEQLHTNRIVPIYPLTSGITQKNIRRIIFETVKYWAPKVQDYLMPSIKSRESLIDLDQAMANIHFPQNNDRLNDSRKRLSFDEIFFLQLGVLAQKYKWENNQAEKFQIENEPLQSALDALPFKLTNAQLKVLDEIIGDLNSGKPMNRLIQGDVGSGKTVLAGLAIQIVAQKGAQSAFLAPTSLLAEQHYRTLLALLSSDGGNGSIVKKSEVALLIGDTPERLKTEIRERVENGEIKVLIGTHAILENPVNFKWLQLVIIDEQHRFGVSQRALLRNKGKNPHLLVMTATPIPRSLALTIYGDLDLSIIDEMPIGRKPVETHILSSNQREDAYQLIGFQVEAGHQAFIIYPLIDSEEDELYKSAIDEYRRIQKEVFPQLNIGLMHGRLKQEEKDAIMQLFRDNKINILVSTTVIEVGMDIPNATVVLIEGADHFGLAQLHQIRGRVGRGSEQSYCLLIPENDTNDDERLATLARTNNGFVLAEFDLKTRGPGDFLGTRQSGYTGLRLASLTDSGLIDRARLAAKDVFDADPVFSNPANNQLIIELQSYWPNLSGDIS
jgi:ATP-dependent DNA helicase RecG